MTAPFRADRLSRVRFEGTNDLGRLFGDTVEGPAELRNVRLVNCRLGDQVRVVNVGGSIENYEIDDGATVENVGKISAGPKPDSAMAWKSAS